MKKTLFLSLLVAGLMFGCAARKPHIQWESNLDKGLAEAKASNRNVVIDFTSPT
ncbi:MAG: hypothetical protein JSV84_05480 [Gemmatimonadota bacterium]|nr:MAG: hypothetical protein JSV84_05480 [Gemmatimonadota bacterium]